MEFVNKDILKQRRISLSIYVLYALPQMAIYTGDHAFLYTYLDLTGTFSIAVFPSPRLGAEVLLLPVLDRNRDLPRLGNPLDLRTSV